MCFFSFSKRKVIIFFHPRKIFIIPIFILRLFRLLIGNLIYFNLMFFCVNYTSFKFFLLFFNFFIYADLYKIFIHLKLFSSMCLVSIIYKPFVKLNFVFYNFIIFIDSVVLRGFYFYLINFIKIKNLKFNSNFLIFTFMFILLRVVLFWFLSILLLIKVYKSFLYF